MKKRMTLLVVVLILASVVSLATAVDLGIWRELTAEGVGTKNE